MAAPGYTGGGFGYPPPGGQPGYAPVAQQPQPGYGVPMEQYTNNQVTRDLFAGSIYFRITINSVFWGWMNNNNIFKLK